MKILYDLSYVQEDIYSSVYYHAKSTFEYLKALDANVIIYWKIKSRIN